MGKLILEKKSTSSSTVVSNYFIDTFMPRANGEYVKIYMYLLKCAALMDTDLSVNTMADTFDHTEKDVLRALRYWEQLGLVALTYDKDKQLSGIKLEDIENIKNSVSVNSSSKISSFTVIPKEQPISSVLDTTDDSTQNITSAFTSSNSSAKVESSVSDTFKATLEPNSSYEDSYQPLKKHTYSPDELQDLSSNEDVKNLLYIAQVYLGKTLNQSDTAIILYLYDVLKLSPELIDYLIDYCVSNNHKSLRYIEKVALDWDKHGITNPKEAKDYSSGFNNNCYPVLKAFGLTGRNPAEVEKTYIAKWTDEYGFSLDVILDACNRTIKTIHQPSFEYADSILSRWKKKGVTTINDLTVIDEEHKVKASETVKPASKTHNSFNSFNQRNYDYDELERKLLKIR